MFVNERISIAREGVSALAKFLALSLIALTVGGCDSPPADPPPTETRTMQLTSTAFDRNGSIPAKYTGLGQDISPPLAWTDVPHGAKSLALICEDPDAPSREHPRPQGPWVHWVIYNIPAGISQLPEAIPREATPDRPSGARQGKNDFPDDNVGFRGPMPPEGSGPHRYLFRIYALDRRLELEPDEANKKTLLDAMRGHILAEGELMGTSERE